MKVIVKVNDKNNKDTYCSDVELEIEGNGEIIAKIIAWLNKEFKIK